MKRTCPLIPLLLTACFVISACSKVPGGPPEAEARAAVEEQIKALSQGCIKLLTFHKTGETELANLRLVHADAEIEFLEDCNWPIATEVLALKTIPGTPPNVKKGEHRKMKLTVQFHKTDQGWEAAK